MKKLAAIAIALTTIANPAFAVLPEDEEKPPKPTPTSTKCPDGTAWDERSESCAEMKASLFSDLDRFRAARELAYAGRLESAQRALDAMTDQSDARVLTYRGFIARKTGDWNSAKSYYAAALVADPNNLLARSYYGMGLAKRGDIEGARQQLKEIRARGGRETWPERALLLSLHLGGLSAY
ncbi:tetratricopeptide repeat protein [uncultured Roseibium sp.]|uniref:tetratricopeptide repeat protein n=1 Tax=uncultured Roseibium sp. TaxID=1936171 RepID=UPI0026113B20|nr:tetratricopeptide repeat protein [uncultured Roseibium sp.]